MLDLKTQEIPPFLAGWRRDCCGSQRCVLPALKLSMHSQKVSPIKYTVYGPRGKQKQVDRTFTGIHTNINNTQINMSNRNWANPFLLRAFTSKICVSECMHAITKSHAQPHLLILQTLTFRPPNFHAQNLGVSPGLQLRAMSFQKLDSIFFPVNPEV